jgi:sortase A
VGGRILTRVAIGLIAFGALLLAFVAYQLWGTSFYEHAVQNRLRAELPAWLDGQADKVSHAGSDLGRSTGSRKDPATSDDGTTTTTLATNETSSKLPSVASAPGATTAAPPIGTGIGYLVIPKIGLDEVITEGVGEAQLQGGPGHYPGTSMPGQAGNAAIAGHRTTYAAPFYNLNELSPGNPVYVLTTQGLFRYTVESQKTVQPSNVSVLNQTSDSQLTLTTCNPRYSASQRLVVVARLDVAPAAAHSAPPPPPNKPTVTSLAGDGQLAGNGPGHSVAAAVLWGILTLLLGALVFVAWRHLRRFRTASLILGVPVVVLVLLIFFQSVSLVLPASF